MRSSKIAEGAFPNAGIRADVRHAYLHVVADCKENANPQHRKPSFGSSLQPTKLSFTGAAIRAYERQGKAGPTKQQPVQNKSLKAIKEAGKPVVAAKAQKTRVLADMTPKKRTLGTTAPDRELKRSRTGPAGELTDLHPPEDGHIGIADEIAGLLEDEPADSSRSEQAGNACVCLGRAR